MHCSKCLRSIGLWLFKREIEVFDSFQNENYSKQKQNEQNEIEKSIYSEEYSVIKNILNIIEIEEKTSHIQNEKLQPNETDTSSNNQTEIINKKKRKLIDISISPENEMKKNNSSKLFDPVNEHYTWCPWRKQIQKNQTKLSIFQMNYNLVNKYMKKKIKNNNLTLQCENEKKESNLSNQNFDDNQFLVKSKTSNEELLQKSNIIMEKVKSAQSLLINCASHYSL
jgi:hypothetical protein